MSKCGKGCMPECQFFTTGGCMSPFNCPYKWEEASGNRATTAPDTGIQKHFQSLVANGVISQEPANYDAATLKMYIGYLEAENAELRARLEKAVEFPCEITGNLSFTKTKGKEFTYMYEVAKQKIQTTLCIENDHFEIINDDVCFYFNRDDNHEAELKGGIGNELRTRNP